MHRSVSDGQERKCRSGGTTILEGAFTLIPLFALICGFADVALMLFRWSTLQNAVREGCRYAVTFQTFGSLGQDASIEQVVQQYAMSIVSTTDNPQRIFVDYYAPFNLTKFRSRMSPGTGPLP
jgi:Flp pilus assembly protein TadG